MLLALASGNTFLDGTDQLSGTISSVSPDLAAVAKQAFYDFGERPTYTERVTYGQKTCKRCFASSENSVANWF